MSAADPDAMDLDSLGEAVGSAPDTISGRSGVPVAEDDVLVPPGGAFEGQVAITGPTRIEGSVRGSLRGPGDLFVGAHGRIEGRVECESLESAGEIVGPVSVRTRARLEAGARLDGDLCAPTVVFDEAAVWNGRALVGAERVVESSDEPSEPPS
ncbi:MAG: polymer-forming cytoskeletal protein [Deltaproteobacteria bacterium]|nr:polymer-forming cytoskeletal protein [Deltaproteobacteria bacterium]